MPAQMRREGMQTNQVGSRIQRAATLLMGLTLALLASAVALYAQQDRATIEGLVTDASGALVSDAQVSIVRLETNDTVVLKTNSEGRFFAPNLPVGSYRVTVKKEGFETAELGKLILQSQMSA